MNPPGPESQGPSQGPPGFRGPQYMQKPDWSKIRFSKEEVRAIKECNRECFYQRCIPIGSLLGFGTYYGVKSGYFKPNAKLGAAPKVIVAVVFGFILGRISYQKKCAEKLMQLPNSQIGEMLRQRKRGNFTESFDSGFGPSTGLLAPFGAMSTSDDDSQKSRSFDSDAYRPQFDGLDESFRPSIDNPIYEEEMPPVQKNVTTYEELRKQNREEYQQKRPGMYKDPVASRTSPVYQPTLRPSDSSSGKNKYGDDME